MPKSQNPNPDGKSAHADNLKELEFRLYGRNQHSPLSPLQQELVDAHLDDLRVTVDNVGQLIASAQQANKPVWLEIGFGGGEHLAWHAEKNPDVQFIGAEPFLNGVAKLITEIQERNLSNVRILDHDARPLLMALPENSIDRLFVLHPDPWHKKRHHKRRIIGAAFLAEAHRFMKSGAVFRLASDIPDYIRWSLMHIQQHNLRFADKTKIDDLAWQAEKMADWENRPDDWPQTRYEAKAHREGRVSCYLEFIKR